jgi:hypothetical protein
VRVEEAVREAGAEARLRPKPDALQERLLDHDALAGHAERAAPGALDALVGEQRRGGERQLVALEAAPASTATSRRGRKYRPEVGEGGEVGAAKLCVDGAPAS